MFFVLLVDKIVIRNDNITLSMVLLEFIVTFMTKIFFYRNCKKHAFLRKNQIFTQKNV
jgi:hypothetical protein